MIAFFYSRILAIRLIAMIIISFVLFFEWISELHEDMLNEARGDKKEWEKQRYCKKKRPLMGT